MLERNAQDAEYDDRATGRTPIRTPKRRSRHVFCEVLPRLIVENLDAVVDAKSRVAPGQQVFRKIIIQ
jgi:hypothetical protein